MKAIEKVTNVIDNIVYPYTSVTSNGTIGGSTFACTSRMEAQTTYNFFIQNNVYIVVVGNYITWYYPYPTNISSIKLTVDAFDRNPAGEILASNDGINWTLLTVYDMLNFTTQTISISNNNYFKYFQITFDYYELDASSTSRILLDNITATKKETTLNTIGDNERNYYKYSYSTFNQPALNNNNLLGGYQFAVYPSSIRSASYDAFQAFDQSSSTLWIPASGTADTTPEYVIMYNPKPLNITSIQIHNGSPNNTALVSGNVQYSDDNSNWTTITTWTNSTQTANAVWDIGLSSNTGYHKYYKLYISEWKHSGNYTKRVSEITLIGTEQTVISGTDSDYDYYLDLDTYKTIGG